MFLKAIFFLPLIAGIFSDDCALRSYGADRKVCVCNETYCDKIEDVEKRPKGEYVVYTSNIEGLRFAKTGGSMKKMGKSPQISVDRGIKYQEIYGFGGAFTDATGINIMSLKENARKNLMDSYFSKSGIEYNVCRVPIGGTDFSTHGYSYDDGHVDRNLTNFKLAFEDYAFKIPLIKEAIELTDGKLKLFGSAWTAPVWMKTNHKFTGFGFIIKDMYQVWANYYLKFLDSYKDENITFWAITTGNEPSLAISPLDTVNTVGWTYSEMRTWIAENLGPTIRDSQHSATKIMALDDQRFFLPWYMDLLFQNNKTKAYIDGIAVHFYWDLIFSPDRLTETHNQFPDKFIMSTEACEGTQSGEPHVLLGSWDRGEDYAHSIIQDLNHWVVGWIDWNMALNLTGGPNYVENFVDSPIIVNSTSQEFYKQPMFYALAHFSKFVPRGSVRILSDANTNRNLQTVAFLRPDNGTAVVILNTSNGTSSLIIGDESKEEIDIYISARSITTIVYW